MKSSIKEGLEDESVEDAVLEAAVGEDISVVVDVGVAVEDGVLVGDTDLIEDSETIEDLVEDIGDGFQETESILVGRDTTITVTTVIPGIEAIHGIAMMESFTDTVI